jgi:hypothetical protein
LLPGFFRQARLDPANETPGQRIIDRHERQSDNRRSADVRPDRTHFAVVAKYPRQAMPLNVHGDCSFLQIQFRCLI